MPPTTDPTPVPLPADPKDALDYLSGAAELKISLGNVIRELFRQFGGPAGFAEEVKLDFDALEPGAATRVRIESDILRTLGNYDGDIDDLPADSESLRALLHQEIKATPKDDE